MENNLSRGIHFQGVSFHYPRQTPLFSDLTLDLTRDGCGQGHIIGLMGSSGAGKSTLLNLILGIRKPDAGRIDIQPFGAVISYIPQEPILFDHLTP